jgi:tetrahydromethanopterin S-methyltransferase subunit G
MTDKKKTSSKKSKSKNMGSDTARKIWLAGIGAYGKAFSEAKEGLTKVSKETSKVFDDLVEKGEVIETMVSYKSKEVAHDVKQKVGGSLDIGKLDIDERIAKMRARLKKSSARVGLGDVFDDDDDDGNGHGETNSVAERLDKMEAKLDLILKALAPQKPAAKKRTPRRPAAKKAAPKKTTARKSTKK